MDWRWTLTGPLAPSYPEADRIALCPTWCQEINSRDRAFSEESNNCLYRWKVFVMPNPEFQSGWEEGRISWSQAGSC